MTIMQRYFSKIREREYAREQELKAREYAHLVGVLIRERYSVNDELAILRQKDTKVTEFEEYDAFCEEMKKLAKERIYGITVEEQI